jgi:thioesterase superfamily protein 4
MPYDHYVHRQYFEKIPWCAAHISDPEWSPCPTRSREPKVSTEDSFIAEALSTERTVPRCFTICKAKQIPIPQEEVAQAGDEKKLLIPVVKSFWQLENGINGFPGIAHGGLIGTLLDEELGILLSTNTEWGRRKSYEDMSSMTAYLNISYKAPLRTPGVVLVTAEVTRQEGRKTFMRAEVIDEKGTICAIGEGLYIDISRATKL